MFFDDKMTKPFYTKNNPETFVKYGKYEMRLMDKVRIEAGFVTKAKVKWYGIGTFAYPYLWKTDKSDIDYQENWGDPRKPKAQKVEKETEKQESISNDLKRKKGRGM